MISPRTRGLVYLQALLDAAVTLSCFWVFLLLFVLLHPGNPLFYEGSVERYLVYSLLASGAILLHSTRGVYEHPRWWSPNLRESHSLSLNQVVHVAVVMSLFLVATKDKAISRIFLFSWLPLLYFVLLCSNRFLPAKLGRTFFQNRGERALLMGPTDFSANTVSWIEYQKTLGTEFLTYLPDFSITDMARLERTLKEQRISKVILTEVPDAKFKLQCIVELCERLAVRLLVLSNFENLFRHKVTILEDSGLQFIGLRDEPLESPLNRALKRLLDLSIALPVILFVLPVITGIVWLFQRIQSPGPVFFRQQRMGLQNQIFTIYKFRSMHPNNSAEDRQAHPADDRIYPAGRWLRKTSLDELPQFWNVLRGEMSLVGPRPHLLQHNEQFARIMKTYYVRSMVKPGITGLAQVRGYRGETRSEADVVKRIESDIDYLETWSFSLDLIILARTLFQVIIPPKTAL